VQNNAQRQPASWEVIVRLCPPSNVDNVINDDNVIVAAMDVAVMNLANHNRSVRIYRRSNPSSPTGESAQHRVANCCSLLTR
jgi:hypothetical protein